MTRTAAAAIPRHEIVNGVDRLAPWFHNIDLGGVWTAPDHFLGDYPRVKFAGFAGALPDDLTGKSVLDIGCNAGFYSIEMKRRGAEEVVGIDSDDRYLEQARFVARALGLEGISFRKLSVYDVASLGRRFDVVVFMGVLYHLRHPLLALDLIRAHVCKDLLLFQSMQRGSSAVGAIEADYPFEETAVFDRPDYPHLSFVEREYSQDWTNWWVPNRACTEAMLRSAGFRIEAHPEEEVYLCRVGEIPYAERDTGAVYPARERAR